MTILITVDESGQAHELSLAKRRQGIIARRRQSPGWKIGRRFKSAQFFFVIEFLIHGIRR